MPRNDWSNFFAKTAGEIDGHLLGQPNEFGESRYDTVRIGFVHPLGVQFEVLEDVRTVIVYDVWRIDRKYILFFLSLFRPLRN